MYRWVQVKEEVAKKMEEEGEIARGGCHYYFDK